jgi:hypothetical protein
MAQTPISELVETIKLVRTIKETLDGLVDVVEKLGDRVVRLEQKTGDDAGSIGG